MFGSGRARRAFLVIAAIAGWAALALQLHLTIDQAQMNGRTTLDGVLIFVGYFTILTNIIASLALTTALLGSAQSPSPALMSAIAVYIVVVGVVYVVALRDVWAPQGAQFVADVILHYAMPILVALYWILFVPKGSLRWSEPVAWLVYPAAYLAAALARGALTGFYPYPFIDLSAIGPAAVALNTGILLAAFWGLGLFLVFIDHLAGRAQTAGV